jgi:EmrB/QacA subfamily drug resistance transporter
VTEVHVGATSAYKRVVAVAFVLGLFMDILDTTIVNVALPTLAIEFEADTTTIEWVVTGYLLSLAVWIPASGWLGDRFGTKRIFILALTIFTGASALCGLAWSIESLVLFRVLQGVGGGMLTPVGTAMLYRAFPPIERPRASAILASVTVLAPAIGPVLGGFLVEYASWRWIFFVNLPIGVAGIIFSVLKLHEHKEGAAGRFDVAGFVLAGAGLALVLLGLSEGPVRGWGDPLVVAVLFLGLVLIAALVVVELRKRQPMLDLRLLGERSFRTPNMVSFATTAALIGLLFLLPQFLQGPRGLSPFQSGLTTFPQALGVIAVSRIVGVRLYPVIGPRRLVVAGATAMALLTALFLTVDVETSQWWIRLLMFTRGMAMGFVFIPVQAAAFARIRVQDTGRASALFQAQRQVGAAVGVAFLATVLVERGQALLAGASSAAEQVSALTTAFHDAVLASVLLCAIAAVAAIFLRDDDAAPTMRPRPVPPVATVETIASEAPQGR